MISIDSASTFDRSLSSQENVVIFKILNIKEMHKNTNANSSRNATSN